MKKSFNLIKIFPVFLLLICLLTTNFAQTNFKSPRQEKLLNGLKVLMWSDLSADKVTVKLRVHSGSAFDPQGREGVMKMLSDNIFPNEASRDFFVEDLGGNLEIIENYDFIQINASAKPENLLTLLETLARAVSAPVIDKETTAKLKTTQIEKLKDAEKDSSYVADQAAAKRLFGTFPYGRPILGTADSLAKIDYADLLLAKQRFLTADNATLAISGNFKPDFAYRTARRYFGGWEKADKSVPSAFRQPDEPETTPLIVKSPTAGNMEFRFMTRGLARGDKDFAASEILSEIIRQRLANLSNADDNNVLQFRQEAHILPGAMVLSQTVRQVNENSSPKSFLTDNVMETLFSKAVTDDEFTKARAKILNVKAGRDFIDTWLDVDTFRLVSADDDAKSFQNAAPGDVENLRRKIARQPVVIYKMT